jgi:hypothetical protein
LERAIVAMVMLLGICAEPEHTITAFRGLLRSAAY